MKKKNHSIAYASALAMACALSLVNTPVKAAEPAEGYVYGTVNVPYADFYYGELNDVEVNATLNLNAEDKAADLRKEGYLDAVSSATEKKWKENFVKITYSEAKKEDIGGYILGIKDCSVAIPTALYDQVTKLSEEEKKQSQNPLISLVEEFNPNEDQTKVPAEYKVLNGDGTLTATRDSKETIKVDTTQEGSAATAKLAVRSNYGHYQINITDNDNLPSKDEVEGVIVTTEDGQQYAMLHLENIWTRTGQIAFAVEDGFLAKKINKLKYAQFADLQGKTIASVKYIVRGGADVEYTTNLKCPKLVSNAKIIAEEVPFDDDATSKLTFEGLPADADYKLQSVSVGKTILTNEEDYSYDTKNNALTIKKTDNTGIGRYTVTFVDDNYENITGNIVFTAGLDESQVKLENNQIVIESDKIQVSDYVKAIESIKVNGKNINASIFNEDGSVNFDAKTTGRNTTTVFPEAGKYEIEITAIGYPSIKGQVEKFVFVAMNVPYKDFYATYNLKDLAVWEVEDGIDAVSTATTSKFKGTDGLAKGTYNDGTYILGVTIPVAVNTVDYEKLKAELNNKQLTDSYYFTDLDKAPEYYSQLTISEEGGYRFSGIQNSKLTIEEKGIDELTLTSGYGDYQITLNGFPTQGSLKIGEESVPYTIYGAILNTTDGARYGLTVLENLWYGTKVPETEIAWSVQGGKGLQRAHGNGGKFYQFDMNGATLSGVTVITNLGVFEIPAKEGGLKLPEYYTGDLSALSLSMKADSNELTISGVPAVLDDVTITVSGNLAKNAKINDGKVTLASNPVDGVSYTVSINSTNYPAITRTVSTPISDAQKEELNKWIAKASEVDGYESDADLKEHVNEAQELLKKETATSVEAANLVDELIEKTKKHYPEVKAEAALKGTKLDISLDTELEKLTNPVYSLTYSAGRSNVTLAEGELNALTQTLSEAPTAGTVYTLTIVSDNYQDAVVKVTAEEVESSSEQSSSEEPKSEEPKSEEPKSEEPKSEQPTSGTSTKQEPATETPTKQEPTTETPAKQEPTTENPTANKQDTVKKGDTATVKNVTYKVTNADTSGKGTVAVTGTTKKKATSLTIQNTVKIKGVTFKVTSIEKNAFKGCSKLKKITIKSKNLKKVGKNAFKGIKKNATIKVPSSKLKAYKKLLKGKGQGSKVKIKK